MTDLVLPLVVFIAGVADVSFGTGRMMMVTSGLRWQAAVLAMVQIAVFVGAIGAVVTNLDNWMTAAGYILGWGVGTFLAMWVEDRIAYGYRLVQIINRDPAISVSDRLRETGVRVTRMEGYGLNGPVEVAITVTARRSLEQLRRRIVEIAPEAFITVERAERPQGGSFASEFTIGRRLPLWNRR